jgi:hypothetical protein
MTEHHPTCACDNCYFSEGQTFPTRPRSVKATSIEIAVVVALVVGIILLMVFVP